MQISPVDSTNDADIDGALTLAHAVERHERPDLPVPCPVAFRSDLSETRPGSIIERELARVGDTVVGMVQVFMPRLDNLSLSSVRVLVHPEHRRRGIGTALLDRGIAIARAHGRTQVTAEANVTRPDGGPVRSDASSRFLERHGFVEALRMVNQRIDLDLVDEADERRLYADVMERSADYETISWIGPTPEDMLAPSAALQSTFLVEAPMGDLDVEAEAMDAERMRGDEAVHARAGLTVFTVAARRRGEQELAAITKIGVHVHPGDHGGQWITLASPRHRGKRLGLRVKLDNHRLLRATLPDVRYLHTDNADVNAPMLRVNERLGYRPTDWSVEYRLLLEP